MSSAAEGASVPSSKAPTDVELSRKSDQTAEKPAEEEQQTSAHAAPKKDFTPSEGLTTAEADALLAEWGRNELEEKSTPKWLIFLKLLYQPMPIVIWIAIIIEFALKNWLDSGILLAIQFINAFLGWYESIKAADAVAALKASLKPQATCKRDGKWQNMDAGGLVPGDLVLLAAGSSVPADCLLNGGRLEIDQSALTGESLPVTMYKGDSAKMGSTVTRGETEGTVEFTGKHTFFGKTATMLQAVGGIGHLQKILLQIMIVLVGVSLVLCLTCLGYLMGKGGESFGEALEFVVVVLVASIPMAIEIVCTATLALGSRQLSGHGAIVTRLASIEEMAGMNMLCSDKTGTLTLNKMVIQEDTPIYTPGETQHSILISAALAAKWKEPPRDALDTLVLKTSLKEEDLAMLTEKYEQTDFLPFDPTIKRTEGSLREKATGKTFKTTKGAPHIILKLVEVDQEEVAKRVNWKVMDLGRRGIRSLAVARTNDEGKWQMLGILTFLDPPRPDTKDTIEKAMEYGVDVKMITGDHQVIAKETARMLGLGTNIPDAAGLPTMDADGKIPKDLAQKYGQMMIEADGFAQVYPEHKYLIVETLRQFGYAVGMTGDGVNDAPALKRADVGIAVQGSTDAARAAADMVLTEEGLSVIVHAIHISRCIFARMKNFINYRIACTLQLVCFFFVAVLALHPSEYMCPEGPGTPSCWDPAAPHFFKMPVLMLILITVLNDGTLCTIAYDYVVPSAEPEKWNLPVLWIVSFFLAMVAMASSLLLLWAGLDSNNPNGIFHKMGLPRMYFAQIITMMYLKISVSDFLTLFAARTHHGLFFSMRPGLYLSIGAALALAVSTILACVWPESNEDGLPTRGLVVASTNPLYSYSHYTLWPLWIWIYCFVWFVIQDVVKLAVYWILRKFNAFQINTSKMVNNREAKTFANNPMARVSAGMVEGKLLEMKVEKTLESVTRVARQSNEPTLRRVSQDLTLMRNSVKLARQSMGTSGPKAGDLESGDAAGAELGRIQGMIAQMEAAVKAVPESDRAEIAAKLDDLKATAARMLAVDKLAMSQK